MKKEQLESILNGALSPENIKDMPMDLFVNTVVVKTNVVASEEDLKMFVVEALQKAAEADDEFPIHYYTKEEPLNEEAKVVDAGPMLTDNYIKNNLKGE